MVLPTPDLRGNRSEGTVLPKHLLSLRHDGACIKQIPLKTLLPVALAIGALSYLHGLIQEMLPCRCEGRAERGDSANSLKRAAAHRSTSKPSGRYEKTGLERPRAL